MMLLLLLLMMMMMMMMMMEPFLTTPLKKQFPTFPNGRDRTENWLPVGWPASFLPPDSRVPGPSRPVHFNCHLPKDPQNFNCPFRPAHSKNDPQDPQNRPQAAQEQPKSFRST